jgi:predicted HTH transcriptional regulator
MLHVENEEELSNDKNFSSAVTSTSYDALTPLSIARLHENVHDLRRTQESLRQAQLLAKVEGKGQKKEIPVKDISESASDDIKDNDLRQASTHAVLMEHAARPVNTLASSFQMKKLSRREQILALFVRGVDVSIKDIAARIKGCSEKTIQRELNALLYDNVIERIGEKRWSRYILR